MTNKEYIIKSAKLLWFDYIPIIVMLFIIFHMFNYIVGYFSSTTWVWFGVILSLYILGFIFLAIKPYIKLSNLLEKEGYEQTEKEKVKESNRVKKDMERLFKKQDKKQEKFKKKWNIDHFRINSFEDLRKASFIQIIRWRMKK